MMKLCESATLIFVDSIIPYQHHHSAMQLWVYFLLVNSLYLQ